MEKLRIAIVNDMKLTQELLRRFIHSVPEFEIAWVASNGQEAIDMAAKDTPDLILMDLLMPVLDGVKATKIIMKNTPCAILIVTASLASNSSKIFEAMGFGALDVVMTPIIGGPQDLKAGDELYKKIETISRLLGKAITITPREPKFPTIEKNLKQNKFPPLVVIGSSTGGPFALSTILSQFPSNCPYGFVVIQHVDEKFAPGFASWLGTQIKMPVRIAANGDTVKEGTVLVAGKNDHLVMTSGLFVKYDSKPVDLPFRPSVDVFFQSVALNWPTPSVAVLLTGMGSDGALGMKALFNAGWQTIAEHQSSCVVYGMPKAAVELGAAKEVLLLEIIASSIVSKMNKMH